MHPDAAKYGHLLRAVYGRPWAIAESALHDIVDALELAAAGQITREEVSRMLAFGPATRTPQRTASVRILPVHGVITQGEGLFGLLFGGTTVDEITADFRAALTDKEVDGIVLDVNSPGGTIDGVEELASLIRSARGKKPIHAIANGAAESAAYWIASAADQVAVTPSGSVGSVGVFTAHRDLSVAAEQAGVKTTLISYGRYKTEGNPWEPLGDEARAEIQGRVDHYGRMFERAVARGRGVTVEKVRADFGQGRSIVADDAVRLGLADRMATLDETVMSVGRSVLSREPQNPIQTTHAAARSETPADDGADLQESLEDQQTEPQAAAATHRWKRSRDQLVLAQLESNLI